MALRIDKNFNGEFPLVYKHVRWLIMEVSTDNTILTTGGSLVTLLKAIDLKQGGARFSMDNSQSIAPPVRDIDSF